MPKLDDKEFKELETYLNRKNQLKLNRVQTNQNNFNIEQIWRQADADYVPHELGYTKGRKKVLVENERTEVSSYVSLEKDNWRSKISSNNLYIKIQTAISILFDRNPEAIFDPLAKRFEANTAFIEKLYHRTWTDVNIGAKKELRKFIFNLAKYGWAPARRYYKRVVRKDMKTITSYNLETKEFTYKKKDMVDIDDVFFESKNPFNVWIDDMAKPDDPRSRRDWLWREVYDKESFEALLEDIGSKYKADEFQYSSVPATSDEQQKGKQYTSDNLIDVYFYENRQTDKFIIEAEDKIVYSSPLPTDNKELSLVDTYWTLRDTESPYGIGLNEIMRGNKVMYDRINNMTIDQVVLSIYKMVFVANSEQLDDEGGESISVEPGKIKKVLDPKNITTYEIPGPNAQSFEMRERLEKGMEDDTGITKTLEGEITGKTAFEISQAQQGALKRLSTPLRNIKSALEWDAKLCINLMRMIYSVPKVYSITEPELITEYIASVNDDKDRYFVDQATGVFNATKYREFQLNLETSPTGEFQPTEKKQFLMAKPQWLDWEGEITIRIETMIEMSKPLERQQKLEMSNIILPLILQGAANPALVPIVIKPIKQIVKLYDEDPKDWVPEEWLSGQVQMPIPMMGQEEQAQTLVPQSSIAAPESTSAGVASAAQQLTP